MSSIKALGRKVLSNGAQLILFGSQARKDAHEESDWDLLILLGDNRQNTIRYTYMSFKSQSMTFSFCTPSILVLSKSIVRRIFGCESLISLNDDNSLESVFSSLTV